MNNGLAERKWPNQPPQHVREITIQKARFVMAGLVSGGRLADFGFTGPAISPTLNVVHAESTNPRSTFGAGLLTPCQLIP